MNATMRPPRGSLRYDGATVRSFTRAPSGEWFLERDHAPTVLVAADELLRVEVVQ